MQDNGLDLRAYTECTEQKKRQLLKGDERHCMDEGARKGIVMYFYL